MQRQSRPRSQGGRRLKSGSEINSLQNSLQTAIKEEPGAKDQTTSVLLPTRIPHRRHHSISTRKKLKHTSPTQLSPTESHLLYTTCWITQGSELAWTCLKMLGDAWTGLNMLGDAWTGLNMLEDAWTCLNMLKHAWSCWIIQGSVLLLLMSNSNDTTIN